MGTDSRSSLSLSLFFFFSSTPEGFMSAHTYSAKIPSWRIRSNPGCVQRHLLPQASPAARVVPERREHQPRPDHVSFGGWVSEHVPWGAGADPEDVPLKEPWLADPAVVPLPFRQHVMTAMLQRASKDGTAKPHMKPLKLAIMWNDGMVTPQAPVMRGLEMVVGAVRQAGHKVGLQQPFFFFLFFWLLTSA